MKHILLGAAVFGMLMVSAPTESSAQITFNRPGLPAFSYVPQRERSFAVWSPVVDSRIPDSSRQTIQLLNDIVFGASNVSRVSRFFGIRDGRF